MVAVFIHLIAVELELASSAQSLVFRIVLDGGTIFHRIWMHALHSVVPCGNGVAS